MSEIEQYSRVVLDVQPGDAVSGEAVADVVHLLAELLENATAFSPKTTQVIVSGHLARDGGLLVRIADAGIGVPGDRLEQLNVQLAHPPAADGAVTRHMGLFAVAHLAARHGITVVLAQPPDGGTTAEVHLPAGLISPDATPGWRRGPGQAGEVLRTGAGGEQGPRIHCSWPHGSPPGPRLPRGLNTARQPAASPFSSLSSPSIPMPATEAGSGPANRRPGRRRRGAGTRGAGGRGAGGRGAGGRR